MLILCHKGHKWPWPGGSSVIHVHSNIGILLNRLDWVSQKAVRYESKGILVQACSDAFLTFFRYADCITCSFSSVSYDIDLQKVKSKLPFFITHSTLIAENIHSSLNSKYIFWCVLASRVWQLLIWFKKM